MKLSIMCLLIVFTVPLWPTTVDPSMMDMTPVIRAIERAWVDIYDQIKTMREIEGAAL